MTPNDIQKLRRKLGLSVAELADSLGVSRQAVGLWELGKRRPGGSSVKLMEAMARDAK